ncbi:glycosyltransferase family 4 protein [Nocardioides piscis]|uniref:Glycosyltransferase family 4 protein n=1 Tax=Nocardioides piscis TaxID=2714938 RepID=A0A6G7YDC2_9ACTN|nr:glycosyltransferase family 4 protein [Nocardioides piscis]QIK74607.1 glycosyltransferase family 4 protein [Nocardioides piscis]
MSARGGALRICLVANSRFPISEPFTGGLESMTWHLAHELVRRGHEVAVFAAPGSDPALGVIELAVDALPDHTGRLDVDAPQSVQVAEHHAYLALMLELARDQGSRFDVLHNNSLHYLPVAMASALPMPMVTTLHTPPLWWLESAVRLDRGASTFAAVSRFTAASWAAITDCSCVPNGVDVTRWPVGPGGDAAVWSGRLVAEKAPHEAIAAARLAGIPIVLAGPVLDEHYFRTCVEPLLGADATYAGHLDHADLAALVGSSAVAVVTPAWDEPYGLVAAEALACGTPVAAFARGGLPEVLTDQCGRLAGPGDVAGLAAAIGEAARLDRARCREHAVTELSLTRMVDRYEALYRSLAHQREAA